MNEFLTAIQHLSLIPNSATLRLVKYTIKANPSLGFRRKQNMQWVKKDVKRTLILEIIRNNAISRNIFQNIM